MRLPLSPMVLLAGLAMSATARARSITQAPLTGHPETAASFTHTGAPRSDAAAVHVDTKETLSVKSSGAGAIENALTNPVTAQPGRYIMAALRRRSRAEAKASCLVYVGAGGFKVYALTSSGGLAWTYTSRAAVSSSPAVAGGIVYVGSVDQKLYAINATDGALVWAAPTGNAIDGSPAVASGLVFVGSNDGRLHAFNAHTGAVQSRSSFGVLSADRSPSGVERDVLAASAAEHSAP